MSFETSVVIPNYNNEPYIATALEAVLANPGKNEVIVVDDRSSDNSAEIVRKFPVKLIQNQRNSGPTKTRNIGARQATGDYLLFLDGDAIIDKNYIPTLTNFISSHPFAGVVSGKVVESSTGERMWYNFGYDSAPLRDAAAEIIHAQVLKHWNNPRLRRLICAIATPITLNLVDDKQRRANWVIEMGFMTRRPLFERLNGLDESFIMFYEGPDYCRRVRDAGYEVWYTPESSVHHLGGHSHSSEIRQEFFDNSRIRYYEKYPTNPLEVKIAKLFFKH